MRASITGAMRLVGYLVLSCLFFTSSALGQEEAWKILKGHEAEVYCVDISPDNSMVASGDAEGLIRLWDVATAKQIAVLKDGFSQVVQLFFLGDGKVLLSYSRQQKFGDNSVQLQWWDVENKKIIRKLVFPLPNVGLRYCPKADMIASNSGQFNDSRIHIREASTGKALFTLPGFDDSGAHEFVFSADGQMLAATGRGGQMKIWHLKTREEIASYKVRHGIALAFRPDGKILASVDLYGTVTLFDVEKRETCKQVEHPRGSDRTLLAYTQDGKRLLMTRGPWVEFLDPETLERKQKLGAHVGDRWIRATTLSRDGTILITTGDALHNIKLWKLPLRK